jgi:hypothetical protein
MLRSLFSGISGLRAHQQMLDVTSNNIAKEPCKVVVENPVQKWKQAAEVALGCCE